MLESCHLSAIVLRWPPDSSAGQEYALATRQKRHTVVSAGCRNGHAMAFALHLVDPRLDIGRVWCIVPCVENEELTMRENGERESERGEKGENRKTG